MSNKSSSLNSFHCRLTSNSLHPQAAAAIAIASAIKTYGFSSGQTYCKRQGLSAPASLIRLARQLAASKG